MIVYSGSNTDYKSSEPLKTLVMLCYVMLCYDKASFTSNGHTTLIRNFQAYDCKCSHGALVACYNFLQVLAERVRAQYLTKNLQLFFQRKRIQAVQMN